MRIFSTKYIIYSYNTIIKFVHTIETIVYYNILHDQITFLLNFQVKH